MQQSARLVPRWIAAVLWVAGAVGLFALIGFVILPPIIKSLLTNQLSERLHRSVSIQEVEVNPFRWSLKVSGFVIREPGSDERFVSFEQLDLNVDAMSLIRLGPVVSEVAMDGLFVSVIRHDDLTYNLSDLLDELASGREPEEPDAAPLRFSINNIRLTNGGIDFHDRPKHISHTVRDMDLRIPFLSNMPKAIDIFTTPAFSATVNGTAVAFQGQTKPFNESLATEMNISLTDVAIPAYVEYLPRPLTFALPSAALDSHLTVSFRQYTDRKPALVLQGILLLKHVVIKTLEDRLVSRIPHLAVTVDEVDVFDRTATVESIVLEKPEFHARRDRSGTINFTTLGMTGEPKPEDAANESRRPTSIKSHEGSAFRYGVREFTMRDAKVTWTDATTQPSFAATLAPVTVTASNLTNQPGESADVTLGLTTDAGETLRQQGTVTLEPLSVNGTLELRGVPITRYAPYYSQGLPGTVKAGTISARLQYRYEADPENVVKTLSDLSVSINGLRLIQPGKKEDFLKIPHLSMTGTQVDLVKRSIEIGEVATINGRLRMERAADGTIDLAQLAGSAQEAQGKGEAPADPRPSRALNTVPPWAIELKKLRLEQYAMTVRDLVPKAPATFHIEPVNLVISRLSTATNTQAELSAKVTMNPAGRLSVNGTVGITPVAASLHVNLRELALVPFQPYLSEKMRVTIAGGLLATEGTLTVTQETAQPVIRYSGQAQVGQAALLDQSNGEEFLKVEEVTVTDLQAVTRPMEVRAHDVTLVKPDVQVTVNENGTTNLASLFVESEPTAEPHAQAPERGLLQLVSLKAPPVAEPPGPVISIGTVTVRNGRIGFTDRSLSPHYDTALTDIRMTLTGLTSEPGQLATGELHALVNDTAPVIMQGRLDLLADDFFADVGVHVKGVELSPLGPYADKYAGYLIKKGQLSMDLKYRIEGGTIESTNEVLVKQLAFGKETNSPEATSLPVKLAVSLLKDRSGNIKLDIPVTGSLDDPSFSVGGVILGVVKDMLVKAATSPFSLLSAAAGSDEELSHIDFPPGSAALTKAAQKRLTNMATILRDRPGIRLDIAGRVDPTRDKEALRQVFFERKLKAQKMADLVQQGTPPQSVDAVSIEPSERSRYLKEAYRQEDIPGKPTYIFGILKNIPDADMERMLRSVITVTDDDLRQLAQQRAQAVKEFLMNEKTVENDRLYLVGGEALKTKEKTTGDVSRVDLAINTE